MLNSGSRLFLKDKKPQAAHFCRIRFLHIGFGASLRSTNQTQSAKGLFNSGKMPRLMVYEKYEIPTPARNKKNAGLRPHFFTNINRQ